MLTLRAYYHYPHTPWDVRLSCLQRCNNKKTQIGLSNIPGIACVRCQCPRRECGSVRIGSGECARLEQYPKAEDNLYRIALCVKENHKFYLR
jgi:hypothetical protein